MPLITLGTAEIMAIIAAEQAAAAAAAATATAATAAATAPAAATAVAAPTGIAAVAPTVAPEVATIATEIAANPALIGADVNAGLSSGIVGATPATNVAAEGSNLAAQQAQNQAVNQGLNRGITQAVDPMAEEIQRLMAEEALKTASTDPGIQLASRSSTPIQTSLFEQANAKSLADIKAQESLMEAAVNSQAGVGPPIQPSLSIEPSLFEQANASSLAQNRVQQGVADSAMEAAVNSQAGVEPVSPFMNAFSEAGKFAKANPYITGMGIYGGLYASGALNQKGDAPPPKRTYNNPYTFSPNFQGSSPDPTMYQSKTNYPRYAMGGITDVPPQTNFADPSQSMMGTSQYDMPVDPMSGNIAQRMAEGGVTGSGQMQLNVPLSVGGGGGNGSPYSPAGSGFGGGGGYAPHGGPQVQRGIGGKGGFPVGAPYQEQREVSLPADVGSPAYQQRHRSGNNSAENIIGRQQIGTPPQDYILDGSRQYGAPQMQRGIGFARGGIADVPAYRSGGKMDVYDASLRFADMMDNPSRYTPPDTRFQSVDTFRDTNPNTATKLADEAAETRRKAIEQRSYVNTGAKYLPPSRRPGQLDLGPVGGERGKYDNQESILAAKGGIMGYNLGGYANGGNPRLLRGPGDGMSDNIPATISDRQPARLADGEFVIPADVVSHLGNGSTEAGAKKLHEMMNSVRKARTGNPKQGKKINPSKFMPKK